jgi:hypothetical protein
MFRVVQLFFSIFTVIGLYFYFFEITLCARFQHGNDCKGNVVRVTLMIGMEDEHE